MKLNSHAIRLVMSPRQCHDLFTWVAIVASGAWLGWMLFCAF